MIVQVDDEGIVRIVTPSNYIYVIHVGSDQLTIEGDVNLDMRDNNIAVNQLEPNKVRIRML